MTETSDLPARKPPLPRRGWWHVRLLGWLVAAFTAAAFAIAGAVAIGLTVGPVSLGPLAPVLLDLVSSNVGGYRLTASDALLSWSSEQSRLLIRFVDARIVDDKGAEIASANDISVSFSISALVSGQVAPRSLEITGPTATFMRLSDGSYDIGIRTETRRPDEKKVETANADVTPFIEALLEPPVAGEFNTFLSEITLSNATITFIDEATASIVKAPRGTLTVRRTMSGISAELDGQVSLPGGNWRFYGKAFYDRGSPVILVDAGLENARLGSLAEAGPLFEEFRGADAPLTGKVQLTVSTKGDIMWVGAQVKSAPGLIQMPLMSNIPIEIRAAVIDASYDQFSDLLQLNDLTIDSPAITGRITGAFRLRRDAARAITGWDASLDVRNGHVRIAEFFETEAAIDSLVIDASDDLIADTLTIRKVELLSQGARVEFAGTVSQLAAGSPALRIDGTISNLPLPKLNTIWPKGVATGARDWITENVYAGLITTGTIAVDISAEQMAMERAPDSAATIQLAFEDVELSYMKQMPHLTDVSGVATVRGNSFEAVIDKAEGADLHMSKGRVAIDDLVTRGEPARISAHIDGSAGNLLILLDHEPLGYPSRFGLDPKAVAGTVSIDLGMTVPTWKNLDVDQIGIDVKAHLGGATMPIARDISLTQGEADFAVTGKGMNVKGDGKVAGVSAKFAWDENFSPGPGELSTRFAASAVVSEDLRIRLGVDPGAYLDGDAAIAVSMTGNGFAPTTASASVDLVNAALSVPELGFAKAVGQPAMMTAELERVPDGYRAFPVRLQGSGIDAELDILLGRNGALRRVTANRLAAGRNDVAFTLDLSGAQPSVVADVAVVDLDTLIDALTNPRVIVEPAAAPSAEPPKPSEPPNLRMRIKARRVLLRAGAEAQDLTFNVDLDHGTLDALLLQAKMGQASIDAGLWPLPDGSRRVVFRSDDMGMFIHGVTGFTSLIGGTGQLDLVFPRRGVPGDPTGLFAMNDFRLTEQPFLVRLLGAGSFTGLIDLLQGNGILFTELIAGVTLHGERIEVRDLLMRGPSAGATGDGYVDRTTNRLAARGTLAPIYSLDSLLGEVPLLGKILGGVQGILAITFAIDGTVDDLSLEVSPLSFLAPGIIRRLFEFESPLDNPEELPPVPVPTD